MTIKQGEIVFNLKKKIVEDWSELKHENSSNGKVLAQEFQKLLDQEQIEMETHRTHLGGFGGFPPPYNRVLNIHTIWGVLGGLPLTWAKPTSNTLRGVWGVSPPI